MTDARRQATRWVKTVGTALVLTTGLLDAPLRAQVALVRRPLVEGHRPDLRLPPHEAFAHLIASHDRALSAQPGRGPVHRVAPLPRPAGAAEVLAALFVCADARLDLPSMFSLSIKDLLVFSNPGPLVTNEQIAALERAVEAGTSLALILVHDDCDAQRTDPKAESPSAVALAARVAPAREFSRRTKRSLAESLALVQVQTLLRASPDLARRHEEGSFAVAIGVVAPRSGRIRWQKEELVLPPLIGTRAGTAALERLEHKPRSLPLDVPRDQPPERQRQQGEQQHAGRHQR